MKSNGRLATGSRYEVEQLVEQRLRSSWGRPTTPHPVVSVMHEMIAKLSEDEAWNEIEQRCKTHPHEAGRMDCRGRTCLHVACTKSPPASVITALIAASVRHSEAVLERDKHGSTPLALAIASQNNPSCVAVVRRLLQSCPRAAAVSDHNGFLPLHIACRKQQNEARHEIVQSLLESYPQGAVRECNNGTTPLYCVIDAGNAPAELVKLLAEASPKSVIMNGCGTNPLFLAIRKKCNPDVIRALVEANPCATISRDRCHGFPLRRAVDQHAPLTVLKTLIVAPVAPNPIVIDIDCISQDTIMHTTLECGIPEESLARLLLETSPQVALCESRHVNRTPLAIACRHFLGTDQRHHPGLWKSFSLFVRAAWYNRINNNDPILHAAAGLGLPVEVIDMAMTLHPEQIAQRDENGSFPLHLALVAVPNRPNTDERSQLILSMLDAHPDAAAMPCPKGQTALAIAACARPAVGPIVFQRVVVAAPAALRTQDSSNGLYPFQMCALMGEGQQQDEDDECMQLTAIFTLLVGAPDLVTR